ncbi:hypothetical protein [Fibrella aquatilis]|uniref:Uncharacterized protein n=1 Tax=Fibrella aquatilis TaxID=2817059 RepID=A0A939G8G7_9BACT|nr:hypothetical protein [Fibrella aquatilis]MBO0932915.1 hypothetical protein [Fibrella aquatilis]
MTSCDRSQAIDMSGNFENGERVIVEINAANRLDTTFQFDYVQNRNFFWNSMYDLQDDNALRCQYFTKFSKMDTTIHFNNKNAVVWMTITPKKFDKIDIRNERKLSILTQKQLDSLPRY